MEITPQMISVKYGQTDGQSELKKQLRNKKYNDYKQTFVVLFKFKNVI